MLLVESFRIIVYVRFKNYLRHVQQVPVEKSVCAPGRSRYKTQDMCNNAAEALPYAIWYVPNQYKNRDMCNNVVDRYAYTIEYVPDRLKSQ